MLKTVVSMLGVLLAISAVAEPVRFEGDSIRLRLADDGKGAFSGEMTHQGATYPLTATGKIDGQLKGSFTANQQSFEFTARSTADGLTLESGGKTYRLKRAAAAAVVPAQITFKRVEIHDAQMADRVSHTLYIPEGWSFEGKTEWTEGAIIYPQQNAEIRSPEGFSVRFEPALHLGYSEMDPNFILQLKQNGLWNPQIHHETSGIKPPDDIGEFLVGYMTRNNKAISNVRLIDQKRDRDAEEASRKANPALLGDGELHLVTVEYQRNGQPIREEINLIYAKGQPQRGPTGTIWSYSIVPSIIVAAPPGDFAKVRPLLYSIANSLSATPEWHYASQQVLEEIQAARHAQNMQEIHNWGEAIRKAGEANSKISDARLKEWFDKQKTDDEKQRDRVRRIYDIYTHTTADGSKVGIPSAIAMSTRPAMENSSRRSSPFPTTPALRPSR